MGTEKSKREATFIYYFSMREDQAGHWSDSTKEFWMVGYGLRLREIQSNMQFRFSQ